MTIVGATEVCTTPHNRTLPRAGGDVPSPVGALSAQSYACVLCQEQATTALEAADGDVDRAANMILMV